jgi:glucose-6-phosphate 1-dehydrogenase
MDAMSFVLFGATGDLAKRKIFPALFNLFLDKKMSESFSIIGVGIEELSDVHFQKHVEESIRTFSRSSLFVEEKLQQFSSAIRYFQLDVTNKEGYKKLLRVIQNREDEMNIPENRLFYLSVAPKFFEDIALNVNESGLGSTTGWKRLIIETFIMIYDHC